MGISGNKIIILFFLIVLIIFVFISNVLAIFSMFESLDIPQGFFYSNHAINNKNFKNKKEGFFQETILQSEKIYYPLPVFPNISDDHREFLKYIHDYALYLRQSGVPGIELWVKVTKKVVAYYEQRNDMTIQEKYDAVIRDLEIVFLGRAISNPLLAYEAIKGLEVFYQGLESFRYILSSPFLVMLYRIPYKAAHEFIQLNNNLKKFRSFDDEIIESYFIGADMDLDNCKDFRTYFCDGNNNQIHHTYAYVALGYATDDFTFTNALNFLHEILPLSGGGSIEDYNVGIWGLLVGRLIRSLRDSKDKDGLKFVPEIFGAVFSKNGYEYSNEIDKFVKENLGKEANLLNDSFWNTSTLTSSRELIKVSILDDLIETIYDLYKRIKSK